jgi:hypothetical protein
VIDNHKGQMGKRGKMRDQSRFLAFKR